MAMLHNEIQKVESKKWFRPLLTIAAVSTSILAVINAYSFYKNNIWKPKVTINSIDYTNQLAHITIHGKNLTIKGDSTYHVGYEWGIRFGFTFVNGTRVFDRIELVKNNVVYQTIVKQ